MSETKRERDFSVWRYLESSGEVFCLACGSYGDDEEPPFCPCCGRVYNPRQEMCLYCGPEEKKQTLNNLGDWISTNPCIIDTQKGPTNIPETNGAKGSPYYTTTTGSLNAMEIPIPDAIPMVTLCSGYDTKNQICNCAREPFESDC